MTERAPFRQNYTIDSDHKYESLDILVVESNAYRGMSIGKFDTLMSWFNFLLLGFSAGGIAFGIQVFEEIAVKYMWYPSQAILDSDLD